MTCYHRYCSKSHLFHKLEDRNRRLSRVFDFYFIEKSVSIIKSWIYKTLLVRRRRQNHLERQHIHIRNAILLRPSIEHLNFTINIIFNFKSSYNLNMKFYLDKDFPCRCRRPCSIYSCDEVFVNLYCPLVVLKTSMWLIVRGYLVPEPNIVDHNSPCMLNWIHWIHSPV